MSKTIFFRSFGPQFGLKLKEDLPPPPPPGGPSLDPPLSRWGIKQLGISFGSIFLLFCYFS